MSRAADAGRSPTRVLFPVQWLTRDDVLPLAIVSAVALIVRLLFVSFVHPTPVSDFHWYYQHALQLTMGQGFTTNGIPTAYWPPGWPYFLAAVFLLGGAHVYAGEFAQAALWALSVAFVFLIARHIAGLRTAVASALIYALLPSAIEWTSVLGSEPLYALLWVIATYIWIRVPPPKTGWYAISGIILGAAALVRPTALGAWAPLAAFLWTRAHRKTSPQVFLPPLIVLSFLVATIAPDLVRNYRIFHTFVLICNTGGTTLWIGNNPDYLPGSTSLHDDVLQRMTDDPRGELEADRIAENRAISYILAHPLITAERAITKMRALYARDDESLFYAFNRNITKMQAAIIVNRAYYYAVLALALVGLFLCYRNRAARSFADPAWILLFFNVVYNTLPFIIAPAFDRYHFAAMPFLAVFAGVALTKCAVTMRFPFGAKYSTGA